MRTPSQNLTATQPLLQPDPAANSFPTGGETSAGVAMAETPIPPMQPTMRRKLQTKLASDSRQHVISTRDNSGSMSGQKIKELNMASQALGRELADPANKGGFIHSVVEFNQSARVSLRATAANEAVIPDARASGGTSFEAALTETIAIIQEFANRPNTEGWHYLRPHVLFLSDGHSQASDQTIQTLHEIADVTAIAYGSGADMTTLARVASDNQVHVVGTSGDELRKFLAEVGQTLSQGLINAR